MTEKSRVGRDPFEKKRSSPVRSIVQNRIVQTPPAQPTETHRAPKGLLDRVQEMKIELDLKKFVRALIT